MQVTEIPDAHSIAHLKSKRRIASSTTPADEYISLTVARKDDESIDRGPHPESRLMREDDEVGDAEEGETSSLT
jgi:GC-rich sequence DNA-binding factor